MLIAKFETVKPGIGTNRSYEDFHKFVGAKPHRLGIMCQLYKNLTASALTESLLNIYTNKKAPGKFQKINSHMFEWEVDVEYIKRIALAADVTDTGANGTDVTFLFNERYYEKYDTFMVEGSRQQFIVLAAPVAVGAGWEYTCQLIDPDYSSIVDTDWTKIGDLTHYISNAHPEYSEEGYTKYQSNIERHRNYITTHRSDVNFSAKYAAMEDVFIKVAKGETAGATKEAIFKMNPADADCTKSFMYSRDTNLLWSKCNMDKNGKSTTREKDTGREIVIGDGIVPQIERFANKVVFSTMSPAIFDAVLQNMQERAENATGNKYVFVVNSRLWNMIQSSLRTYMMSWKSAATFLYSEKAGGDVEIKGTFQSYEFAGNTLTFMVDKSFDREFPHRAYGICLDLSADVSTGQPAIQMFTFAGQEFIRNVITGVGGLDGVSSGEVSSPVAGSKIVNMGSAGVGVFAPYKSCILEENITNRIAF